MGSFFLNTTVVSVCFALFEFIVLYVVVFCIILNPCLFFVYTLFALLCVFLSLGLLQACSSKLLQGVAEGGPLRLTRSASFFAGLCGMLSTV